ncbi:MAG: 30S ribosomal protein S12 methylthiotransferase RimO [Phycisphaerae bacterium]|nr:30S ribosomal protein S12 methylthiotransferase RimO [Phycisphaerae bacterium]
MPDPIVVGFISLGCAKNLVDSEVMLARLAEAGCAVTADLADADAIVVNTCGFLDAARQEALEAIRQAVDCKRTGRCRRLVVVGCLVQRDRDALRRAVPEIDVLLGVDRREEVVDAVLTPKKKLRKGAILEPAAGPMPPDVARLRLTPRHYAYLRIAEGCDQHCTFCTIPMIRGPMRSKPPQVVLDEARELIADGVVELNVIAQDTTAYGQDLDAETNLAALLRQLNRLDGLEWIRLMYAYPRHFDDDLIDAVAASEKVVKYVDMPLQHVSDGVLKRMGRRVGRAQIETLLGTLRDRMPEIALRTTLMVGFPGETQAEFDELLDFVKVVRFDALGAFAYSREPETASARLSHHLPDDIKDERLDALMRTQQAIAFAKADATIGRRLRVLVEDFEGDDRLIARHAGQAPEVDSVVIVQHPPDDPGPFLEVECRSREGYDLIAEPVAGILDL